MKSFLFDLPRAPKTYGEFPLVNLPVCPLWARVSCAAKVCGQPRSTIERLIEEKLVRAVWRKNVTNHFLPIVCMPSLLAYIEGLPAEKPDQPDSLAEPAATPAGGRKIVE